jgi:NADPH2:quinone reductase
MIGVTSGEENCRQILENGYSDAIDRNREDIAEKVRELTDGVGVSVVFDSVGKATFDASIESLAPRGYFMSFGSTTGEAPPVPPSLLQKKGSLYFCRPTASLPSAQGRCSEGQYQPDLSDVGYRRRTP